MPKVQPPELRRLMDKKLSSFDQFMNIVLDNTVDDKMKTDIGMVVIRGNSIVTIEALEKIAPNLNS